MAKIRDGSTYLAQHLSANDYYCEHESVAGQWTGRGAEKLGVCGGIHAGDVAFENLRNNRLPDGSGSLTPRDRADRIRFFDFQCSAQKSVSIMAVTVGDERLITAHDESAEIAFRELEKFAARQNNSLLHRENLRTGNVVAGKFRHTASRALDPQVHTHFVTANATWDEKTRSWRALTEFEMVHAIRYAGKVFQNELARRCRQLGYGIEEVRDERGTVTGFEIAGVSKDIRERFSKRRADIEVGINEFRAKYGRSPTTAEIHAITVNTRDAKLAEITTPEVLRAQHAQLSQDEWKHLSDLRRAAEFRAISGLEISIPARERESLRTAIGHIYERRSVSSGHEILAESLNANLGFLDLTRLSMHAAGDDLVALTKEPWLHAKHATPRGLALERWAVEYVARTQATHPALGQFRSELAATLSAEQRRAVADLLATRDQVACLRGAAGVGKTTVLKAVHQMLVDDQRTVFYAAPTSSAADTLRMDGLPNATTLRDMLDNVAVREPEKFAGAVLVVDEAGLASNRDGAEVLRLAERHGARVLFVGDARQHTAVEAGDFLRVLETHSPLHRVELTDIRRQLVQEYRSAVQLMATGAARDGLGKLEEMGWLHSGGADYLRKAVDAFLDRSEGGKRLDSVLAVTPTWAENHAFTDMLRADLISRGVLGRGEIVTVHEPLPWTVAQKARSANYLPGMVITFNRSAGGFRKGECVTVSQVDADGVFVSGRDGLRRLPSCEKAFEVAQPKPLEVCVGDKLLIRANDRGRKLINGEVLHVSAINGGIVRTTEGREIDTRAFRRIAHGFAVTSHKSQSKTAEHVVVAAERLDAKAAYVACSRGRQSCDLHTPDVRSLLDRLPDGSRTAALDLLPASTPTATCSRIELGRETEGVRREPWYLTAQRVLRFEWWSRALGSIAMAVRPNRCVDTQTIDRNRESHDEPIDH